MKLNKTESNLLTRAQQEGGRAFVECGLDRGRSGRGNLRFYGRRERNAAVSLRDKGLVAITPIGGGLYIHLT